MTALYLASRSPRRRELLAQLGVNFEVVTGDVPEHREPGEAPLDFVRRLAEEKARAGALQAAEGAVLGSDTVVVIDSDVLGKPASKSDFLDMFTRLQNRTHDVYTAVSVCSPTRQETTHSRTQVVFREISQAEAELYWETEEPFDKAGGYGIQGLGAAFVKELHGSYTGVVGLPLFETQALLKAFAIPIWQRPHR